MNMYSEYIGSYNRSMKTLIIRQRYFDENQFWLISQTEQKF